VKIAIRQKNLEVTPALRKFIEDKLELPLRRHLRKMKSAARPVLNLELSRDAKHRKGMVYYAEANLSLGKRLLRAETYEENPRVALEKIKEELIREINKFKDKKRTINKKASRIAKGRFGYE